MKILVNCSSVNSTGTTQVALSFLSECKLFTQHEYFVIAGPAIEKIIDPLAYSSNFHFYYTKNWIVNSLKNFFLIRKMIHRIEDQVKPDVVFSVFGPSYWKPKARHIQGFATSQVLYPDSPIFKLYTLRKRLRWQLLRFVQLRLLRYESDELILETNAMQHRMNVKIPGLKTHVVPNTCSEIYRNYKADKYRKIAEDDFFKLLTISAYKRHKNLEIIPLVVDELLNRDIQNVRFYLTLPEQKYNELISERYRQYILNLGVLHPNECPSAYANVDAMLLPTLLESFSASYPEAMSMGKPILTSNYDFATSICGEAAIYFNPLNANSIADAIVRLVNDPKLYQFLFIAGKSRLASFGDAATRAQRYLTILANRD